MPYRLIIADDEPKLIDLIRVLGHWESLDIQIIDECKNGEEALESIIRNRPEIALLDIMMPVYDGITIIEKVREQNIDTAFIIISGYRHFEYAKSAIQLGVVDYLLKPLDEENLNVTLKKACDFIYKERFHFENAKLIQAMDERDHSNAIATLWEYVLSGLQSQPVSIDLERIAPHIGFPLSSPILACISIKSTVDNLMAKSGSLFQDRIVSYLQQAFDGFEYIYHCSRFGVFVLLALHGEKRLPKLNESLHMLYEKICQLFEIYGRFDFRIGYHLTRFGSKLLPETMLRAQTAMINAPAHLYVVQYGEEEAITSALSAKKERFFTQQEMIGFQKAVCFLDQQAVRAFFQAIRVKAVNMRNESIVALMIGLHDIELIAQENLELNEGEPVHNKLLCTISQENFSLEGIINHVENDLLNAMNRRISSEELHYSQAIKKAELYIHQHYWMPLSLEEVADSVGLSSTYFSKLFKQELNIGFSSYLTNVRIEMAQKLLTDTNLSCRVIAERVGYADEKYFQKLFKKQLGVTPSEYRTLFQ